jgi:hypothetical protein
MARSTLDAAGKDRDGSGPALHRARYRGEAELHRARPLEESCVRHPQPVRAPPQARSMTIAGLRNVRPTSPSHDPQASALLRVGRGVALRGTDACPRASTSKQAA